MFWPLGRWFNLKTCVMSYELVEVYNRITWRTRKEYRVGDRFEYVGAGQDRPVFEYVLADQDYGET